MPIYNGECLCQIASVKSQWSADASTSLVLSVANRVKGNKLNVHEISNSRASQGTSVLWGRCKEP